MRRGSKEEALNEKRKAKKKQRERRKTIASKNTQEFFFSSASYIVEGKILLFEKNTLGLFHENSTVRKFLAHIVLSKKYELLYLLVCLINICLIGSFDHKFEHFEEGSNLNRRIDGFNAACYGFYFM